MVVSPAAAAAAAAAASGGRIDPASGAATAVAASAAGYSFPATATVMTGGRLAPGRAADSAGIAAARLDGGAIPIDSPALGAEGLAATASSSDSGRPAPATSVGSASAAAGSSATAFGAGGQIDTDAMSSMLNQRIGLLVKNGVQSARVQLSPEHLGLVDVRIQVADDGASVSFAAHSAPARDALEASLPRLRELFADQGLNLTDASVTTGGEHAAERDPRERAVLPIHDDVPALTLNAAETSTPAVPSAGSERRVDLLV
jgi:hypothetical protein